MTIFSKDLRGGMAPLAPAWLRLWRMRHRFATNPMLHRTILRKSNFRIRTFTRKQI